MSDIIKKTETQPTLFGAWDPFQMMREFFRAEPMFPLRAQDAFTPRFDVKETEEGYVFQADLPGVKEPDLKVAVEGNRLTITGKREEERRKETDTYYTYERSFGSFMRAFTLPETADAGKAQAELKEGVLTLKLPKKPEIQAKQITVKAK
jgi:HSP20 family protein